LKKRGLIQVYTGKGKGKTTAALGLALRAAGAGLKVYIGQFLKGASYNYSELKTLEKIKQIKLEQFGQGCFIKGAAKSEDKELARGGLKKVKKLMVQGKYDLMILDEINIALKLGLLSLDEVIQLINNKPGRLELVLTGRSAPAKILRIADLVTEMREIKHYYKKSVSARKGIEF